MNGLVCTYSGSPEAQCWRNQAGVKKHRYLNMHTSVSMKSFFRALCIPHYDSSTDSAMLLGREARSGVLPCCWSSRIGENSTEAEAVCCEEESFDPGEDLPLIVLWAGKQTIRPVEKAKCTSCSIVLLDTPSIENGVLWYKSRMCLCIADFASAVVDIDMLSARHVCSHAEETIVFHDCCCVACWTTTSLFNLFRAVRLCLAAKEQSLFTSFEGCEMNRRCRAKCHYSEVIHLSRSNAGESNDGCDRLHLDVVVLVFR